MKKLTGEIVASKWIALLLVACGGADAGITEESIGSGTGGHVSDAGSGSGGADGSGGVAPVASGGATSSGGARASGGEVSSGGAHAAGGEVSAGGSAPVDDAGAGPDAGEGDSGGDAGAVEAGEACECSEGVCCDGCRLLPYGTHCGRETCANSECALHLVPECPAIGTVVTSYRNVFCKGSPTEPRPASISGSSPNCDGYKSREFSTSFRCDGRYYPGG